MGSRERHRTERDTGEKDDDYHGRSGCGWACGRRVFPVFVFFFTMVSSGVDTMRFRCSALNVKVVRNSKQARRNDRRNHDSQMVATPALTAFLFHLPLFSCLAPVCGVGGVCLCACLCVSLRHVSGVEQLYQARRMIGGVENMLFSTYSQTKDPVVTLVTWTGKQKIGDEA